MLDAAETETSHFSHKAEHKAGSLASYMGGRDNNLNLIRMLAAVAVLASHSYPLSLGAENYGPVHHVLGVTAGTLAVSIFFVLSGLLITQSFEKRTLKEFTVARVLRLFPGLAAALLLTVFILGPVVTSLTLGEYFTHFKTFTYFIRNITLFSDQSKLPGVFEALPYPRAINGSLWTLYGEVLCYIGVVIFGLAGLLSGKLRIFLAFCVFAIYYVILKSAPEFFPNDVHSISGLMLPFFIGIIFYKFRDHIRLNLVFTSVFLICLIVLRKTEFYYEIFCVLSAYLLFYAAYVPAGIIRRYNRMGDYSYGYYIYAFPVQQLVVYWLDPLAPLALIFIAGILTLFLAVLSWHFIESPALVLRLKLVGKPKRA